MVWVWTLAFLLLCLVGFAFAAIPLAAQWQRRDARQAVQLFHQRRELLEAKFFDLAQSVGKPRGLRWVDCEWSDDVTFGRDKTTRLLTAFVGVNIRFEAIEGGDMEDVAAVSTVRDATALFHFHQGAWGTGGKALFNMNPKDALEKLVAQFEPVSVI
ncbi:MULTISPECIES: hypothetical protein [unclassified Schlesneria]|uniref:hypothetical protein n=1 Tax=Schlesneria TaxID=656899 RepID=UPI0035A12770